MAKKQTENGTKKEAPRRPGRKQLVIGVALLLMLAVVVAVAVGIHHKKAESKKLDAKKISQMTVDEQHCKTGLAELSDAKVDDKNAAGSIALLQYRVNCLGILGDYQQVMSNLRQLKTLYAKTGNKQGLVTVNSNIKDTQYNIDHADDDNTQPNPISADAQKQINDEVDQVGKRTR